ncbi:MAG: DUF3467 domain-containing protein [Planctomycetota bacterium]|jgi:hypothetical protein
MADASTQQVQLRIDESKMATTYANTIRSATTLEEVVLDFGFNLPTQAGPDAPPTMTFAIGSRVIMNWTAAKRLTATLQNAVASYEQHHGEIDMGGGGGGAAPTPSEG